MQSCIILTNTKGNRIMLIYMIDIERTNDNTVLFQSSAETSILTAKRQANNFYHNASISSVSDTVMNLWQCYVENPLAVDWDDLDWFEEHKVFVGELVPLV